MVGLILTAIGLVVGIASLPAILQMIYGRPRLTFAAAEFTGSERKILLIQIKNQPITSRLLKMVGVERGTEDVMAFFEFRNQGTNEIVAKNVSGLLHCAVEQKEGLRVPVLPGFTAGLMLVVTKNRSAPIIDARSDALKPIAEGHYTAFISVIRGEKAYNLMQRFQVGRADHQTIWYAREVVRVRETGSTNLGRAREMALFAYRWDILASALPASKRASV